MGRTSGCRAAVIAVLLLSSADAAAVTARRRSRQGLPPRRKRRRARRRQTRRSDIEQAGATKIDIKGDWLAAGAGGVWLSGDTALYRLDPDTGRRTATIPVRGGPCQASDVGSGAVWTATCKTPGWPRSTRPATVSPRTSRWPCQRRSTERAASAPARAVSGWSPMALDATQCRVARVNPRTVKVTGSVKVTSGAATVRTGEGAVWVANPLKDIVQRIDPATAEGHPHGQDRHRTALLRRRRRRRMDAQPGRWLGDPDRPRHGCDHADRGGVLGDGGDLTAGGGSSGPAAQAHC